MHLSRPKEAYNMVTLEGKSGVRVTISTPESRRRHRFNKILWNGVGLILGYAALFICLLFANALNPNNLFFFAGGGVLLVVVWIYDCLFFVPPGRRWKAVVGFTVFFILAAVLMSPVVIPIGWPYTMLAR
jgi:hypothetical protein